MKAHSFIRSVLDHCAIVKHVSCEVAEEFSEDGIDVCVAIQILFYSDFVTLREVFYLRKDPNWSPK